MEINNEMIEGFDGEFLHPSLDIRNGILVLGFRYKAKSGKDEKFAIVVHGGTPKIVREDEFMIGDKLYVLENRARRLARVNDRWDLMKLNQLLLDYADLKIQVAPNPKVLLQETINLIKRCVELEKEVDVYLVAAWIIGTYFYPAFSAYPFLNPKAPKGSGKSQLLNLLRQLSFNATKASPTMAALSDTV